MHKLLPIPARTGTFIPTPSNVFTTYTISGKPIPQKSDNSAIYSKIPVRNQLQWGSCTIFALFNWDYFLRILRGEPLLHFEEGPEYYAEEKLIGHTGQDWGGYTWSAVGILESRGAILADPSYNYSTYMQNFKNPPPTDWNSQYEISVRNAQQILYSNKQEMIHALTDALSQGYPILFGMTVFQQIYSAPNGVLQMSSPTNQAIGGHEVVLIDYDATMTNPINPNSTGYCKFRNSWGESWGDGGDGWVSFDYLYGNVMGPFVVGVPNPKTPQPAPKPSENGYTLDVSFANPVVQLGATNQLTVTTTKDGKPLANQTVHMNLVRPDGNFTPTYTTDGNGQFTADIESPDQGQIMAGGTWQAPDGTVLTDTTTATWTNEAYQLIATPNIPSAKSGQPITVKIQTFEGQNPIGKQTVNLVCNGPDYTSFPNGQAEFSTVTAVDGTDTMTFMHESAGTYNFNFSWTAPDAKIYTASCTLSWT